MIQFHDSKDSLRLKQNGGIYERFSTEIVKRNLKPGETFVDVGAHIGYYTDLAASIVGPEGRLYAFEPDPENCRVFFENMKYLIGRAPVLTAFQAAASDKSETRNLYRSFINSGDHRLYDTGREVVNKEEIFREKILVSTIRIDDAVFHPIDFMKIDVQGWECNVLRGAMQTIKRSSNIKGIIEYSPKHLFLAGSSQREFFSTLLYDCDFFLYQESENGDLEYVKIKSLKEIHKHVNLFFSRPEYDWVGVDE